MDRNKIRDEVFPDCPIRNVLARIGDKWTLIVLYSLTERGTSLIPHINALIDWAKQNMEPILSDRSAAAEEDERYGV